MHQTDPPKIMILRLKVFEISLSRNIAKFGSMNPFVEVTWNDEKWTSQVKSGGHLSCAINESHIFEGTEIAPVTLKVFHSGLLFTSQEIASSVISSEELSAGKTKDWIELYFEGSSSGKVMVSACMYEERRSEQSTHTTSYASANLKEEFLRKQNELELEKEELEFYKRKYKRKLEKLNQEKRIYKSKVKEIVKKATPKHTEETSSDENCDPNPSHLLQDDCLKGNLSGSRDSDLRCKRHQKQRTTASRIWDKSQDKLNEIAKSMDLAKVPIMTMKKSTSEEKVVQGKERQKMSDWQEVEEIKKRLLSNDEEIELKLDMSRPFTCPRRAGTPKEDFDGFNEQTENQCMTGKLVLYD
jgi:hypothetical protein